MGITDFNLIFLMKIHKDFAKRRTKEIYQVDSTSCHTYGMKNSSG